MNIDQLRYFLTVASTRSISRAANELHLSQPNLSIAIRLMEDELGYELLKRTNRGVELTEKGVPLPNAHACCFWNLMVLQRSAVRMQQKGHRCFPSPQWHFAGQMKRLPGFAKRYRFRPGGSSTRKGCANA